MRITHWAGPAAALHARPISPANPLNELHAIRPAIVLGRAQKVDDNYDAAAHTAGFEVARRVSGGTAVVVGPGECVWVDVVVERGGSGWNDDIGKAGCWMGEQWVAALAAAGLAGAKVHRTGMERRPGSDAVCFAGVGPGEVLTADGAKIVGISQRRTRGWALFQCAIPLRWDVAPLVAVFGPSAEPASDALIRVLSPETAATAVSALADILG
ncbi:MAG: hypothetical protein H0U92_02310 [Actinobacteria bacterium]|nr:hypothetical protein [Actinomycetota bacterium]